MANTAILHAGRGSLTKKLILWLIVIVQLCFIFCFWVIQTGFQDHAVGELHGRAMKFNKFKTNILPHSVNQFKGVSYAAENRVNFVTKHKNAVVASAEINSAIDWKNVSSSENVNQFIQDYLEINTNRLMNITGIEAEMLIEQPDLDIDRRLWCFREGTLNETTNSMVYWNIDTQRPQCKCRKYWHGKDCGQPEVMWRALMVSRNQFRLHEPDKYRPPHRLIYMLEGYFHSLDMLELQIKVLDEVVDHFLIYCTSKQYDKSTLKALQRRLNEIINPQRYILFYCSERSVYSIEKVCNTMEAYRYFKEKLTVKLKRQLQDTDLFLYSNENVIYSREPLKFLKYYASTDMSFWQFRLKHNVYGFYWQHPSRTHLSGFICSFGYLENSKKLHNLLTKVHSNGNIIGDLNHYGGFFCQYCQHPDEIIKELHELPIDSSSHNKFELPNDTRNRFIDTKYLEYLIAHGIHIDGKIQLEKIRQYNDKYFAPSYAEKCKWKYGNILTNLFEAMESDYIIEEAEGGAGF